MYDAEAWHVSVEAGSRNQEKRWLHVAVFLCQWTLRKTGSPAHVLKTHGVVLCKWQGF